MIQDFLDAWSNPSLRHAMVVHFPVVLSLAGIPFAVLAALWRVGDKPRGTTMRWTALAVYLALSVSAFTARQTGEGAEHAIEGSLSKAAEDELEEHESDGHNLWLWPAAVTVLLGVSFVPNRIVNMASVWAAVAVGLLGAERVAHTAEHGGRLVYEFGAGTPDDFAALLGEGGDAEPAADPRLDFFRRQARPVLVDNCFRCHNPRRARRSGRLDQTTIAGLLRGGMSGPAIVPGRPEESLLITAVRWEDPDLQMPPNKEQLSEENIAALERWIAEGAVWEPLDFQSPEEED